MQPVAAGAAADSPKPENAEGERNRTDMFKIRVFGPNHQPIGWWRNFETGEIALFASYPEAERVRANWQIDGEIVPV